MEKEELRRISFYADRVAAAGGNVTVLTDAERLELRDLLERWGAEELAEPLTVSVPAEWGDVRKLNERR